MFENLPYFPPNFSYKSFALVNIFAAKRPNFSASQNLNLQVKHINILQTFQKNPVAVRHVGDPAIGETIGLRSH